MREPVRDELRLVHIKEACDRLLNFFPEKKFNLPEEKSMEFFGIIKNLEIIGEAAYKLSKEFIDSHPGPEWRAIINMRHIMVHGYYHISPEIVKDILETEIEGLRNQIIEYQQELT